MHLVRVRVRVRVRVTVRVRDGVRVRGHGEQVVAVHPRQDDVEDDLLRGRGRG